MENNNKASKTYKTIGEVAKELNLIDKKTGQLQTHTIRYWERRFKQIKPTIRAGRRRYYSDKNIKIISYIKSLLKEKGFTISGVKKVLDAKGVDTIDPTMTFGVYKPGDKSEQIIKEKVKNISKIVKELKKIKDG